MFQPGVAIVVAKVNPQRFFRMLSRVASVDTKACGFMDRIIGICWIKIFEVNFAFTPPALLVWIFVDPSSAKNRVLLK